MKFLYAVVFEKYKYSANFVCIEDVIRNIEMLQKALLGSFDCELSESIEGWDSGSIEGTFRKAGFVIHKIIDN